MASFSIMSVLATVVLGLLINQATAKGDWHTGRATFYGMDAWSIHYASCGYGYLDENVGTGWDVAAMGDKNWDYGGSCGKCKEVRCKPISFKDGYGEYLDRASVCYDSSESVVVTITDTCPCHYPGNAFSNKRWCCGDMYHLDISVWAYEKLADKKWGVIAVEWRDVDCSYQPTKKAWPRNKSGPDTRHRPDNWNSGMDKRPWEAKQGRRLMGGSGSVSRKVLAA